MQDSIYKFMKVGLIHFMAYPQVMKGEGPILETLQKIAEDDFFTAVEVSWIKDAKVRQKAKKLLEVSHLTVAYGAQPRLLVKKLNLNSFDEAERKEAVNEVKAGVDEAYEIEAKSLAFLSGTDPGGQEREQAIKLLVSSAKEICDYAKSKGDLGITLEVFDQEIDKKCLIGPAKDARMVAEAIRAAYILKEEYNLESRILNIHTLKPIDKKVIIKAAEETNIILSVEEHQVGGFSNIVAGVIAQSKKYSTPLLMDMIGVEDRFGESGEPWELTKVFGLTAENIAKRAKELWNKKN